MRRHKWGIFWLVMLAWNAASLGNHLGSDRWGRAIFDLAVVVLMGFMAYSDLTRHSEARLTVTVRRPKS